MFGKMQEWMTPERAIALQGLGQGLGQLAAGGVPDLSPTMQALAQRQQAAKLRGLMEQPGVMDQFTPQQRAALAAMPEGLATQVLMQTMFAPPPAPTKGEIITGNDGQKWRVDPYTGKAEPLAVGELPPEMPVPIKRSPFASRSCVRRVVSW
jgi:hypothetical protein